MNSRLYLGIDVSKGYADFSMLDAERKLVEETFQLYDVNEGHSALKAYLEYAVQTHRPEMIYAAVESTGGFENHWMEVLSILGEYLPIKVARLNPTGVAKHRQADRKHQVTDKTSSIAVARYLINHADRIAFNAKDEFKNHRLSLSSICLLEKQKTQQTNNLKQLLYQYFPEIMPYCRNGMPKKALELLKLYPTSYNMAHARQGKNNKIEYLTSENWLGLRERCKEGLMVEPDPLAEESIRIAVKIIQDLTLYIERLKDQLSKQLPQDKLDLLTSIPGIGKRSATVLLCIIGDACRFTNARQMVAFFGLYPEIKESGDMKKKPHLSKRGNSLLRKTLYMCAMVACQYDPYLRKLYLKAVEQGMPKKAAICKIMVKMLRMIYGMLVHNRKYDYAIDLENRKKFTPKAPSAEIHKPKPELEAMMTLIYQAPISKRNAHIRKEQMGAEAMTRSQSATSSVHSVFLPKT